MHYPDSNGDKVNKNNLETNYYYGQDSIRAVTKNRVDWGGRFI